MHRGVTTGRPVFKGSPFPDALTLNHIPNKGKADYAHHISFVLP